MSKQRRDATSFLAGSMKTHIGHRISQADHRGPLPVHLVARRQEVDVEVGHALELRVVLVGGIDEVLDLGHCELAYANEARSGGDLVAKRGADLGGGEGQLALVEGQQALEVHEHAL